MDWSIRYFMPRYVGFGVAAGAVITILDGVLNANPIAQRLYEVYPPIARPSVHVALGIGFDLLAGVVMAALFVRLRPTLPGGPVAKGLAFGLMVWFLRVVMDAAAHATMFQISGSTVA